MKGFVITIFFLVTTVCSTGQDTTEIQNKIKAAVINWADQKFVQYDNPRFEKLLIFYSDAYEMWKMRPAMLKSRKSKMIKAHENGESDMSDEEFEKEIKNLDQQITKVNERLENMTDFADQFTISFWANIKTNDGITVQYEHVMTLDGNYNIVKAEENSSIGKKSDNTKIMYK